MALSLNDLKKSEYPLKNKTIESIERNANSKIMGRSPIGARPWTTDELVPKATMSRKLRAGLSNSAMNSEWVNEHTSSLNAFDMEVQSGLTQLHDFQILLREQFVEVNRKIKRAAMSPFQIVRTVLRIIQK